MRKLLFISFVSLGLYACGPQTPMAACPDWPNDCETYDWGVDSQSSAPTESISPEPRPEPERPFTGPVDNPATPTPENPVEPPSEPPVASEGHSNASGNNGKGGNYDKTGHEDNGRGNGRGRD